MGATFHGLEIVKSGIAASQIAVNVTSQNIANANTKGYTRQGVVQTSVSAGMGPYQYARTTAAVGQGTAITGIAQYRDEYLDKRYRNANSSCAMYATSLSALQGVESVTDETTTDGLNAVLADFYSALQNLSNNDEEIEYASLLRSAAEKVCNILNEYASQFIQIEEELSYDLELTVNDVNTLVGKIDELNRNIFIATVNGSDCNELKDARNLYLDELSGYMDITTQANTDGTVSILCGSAYLLDAENGSAVTLSLDDSSGSLMVTDGGGEFIISGGAIKGLLQSVNGKGVYAAAGEDTYTGIAYYRQVYDDLAAAFADAFNSLNSANGDLFSGSTAAGISITDEWRNDAAFVVTADDNTENMKAAMDADRAISPFFTGTFEEFSTYILSGLATDVSYLKDITATKNAILESIADNREAISGVSIDEESVNLIRYQKAYQAAARVMTVLDEMLNTLINYMAV